MVIGGPDFAQMTGSPTPPVAVAGTEPPAPEVVAAPLRGRAAGLPVVEPVEAAAGAPIACVAAGATAVPAAVAGPVSSAAAPSRAPGELTWARAAGIREPSPASAATTESRLMRVPPQALTAISVSAVKAMQPRN